MGLLQKAVETYDTHSDLIGKGREGHQVLAPVAHKIANADLEITLEPDGRFSLPMILSKSARKMRIRLFL